MLIAAHVLVHLVLQPLAAYKAQLLQKMLVKRPIPRDRMHRQQRLAMILGPHFTLFRSGLFSCRLPLLIPPANEENNHDKNHEDDAY